MARTVEVLAKGGPSLDEAVRWLAEVIGHAPAPIAETRSFQIHTLGFDIIISDDPDLVDDQGIEFSSYELIIDIAP